MSEPLVKYQGKIPFEELSDNVQAMYFGLLSCELRNPDTISGFTEDEIARETFRLKCLFERIDI